MADKNCQRVQTGFDPLNQFIHVYNMNELVKREGFWNGGAKVQVTGHRRSQVRSQVTGHRPQVRSQVRLQATGHRSQKTIGQWTKLFWTDILLCKNKISQGTLMVFLSFKQY